MNQNRIFPLNTESTTETPVVQTNTVCIRIRKKNLIWILFSAIAIILIVLIATIPTILTFKKNINRKPSTTSTTTTSTTTTTITTTTATAAITSSMITATTESEASLNNITIANNTKWKRDGTTVAGGYSCGDRLYQFFHPTDMYIDDDAQTIYIADTLNFRIMEWKFGANIGQVVAGGNGAGDRNDQFYIPTAVTLDKENDSLIICDFGNKRVMRWSRQNRRSGEITISNITCTYLTMDSEGYLYVTNPVESVITRWKVGDTDRTIVAGGNGIGDNLNQLNQPYFIFIDQDQSVYVADTMNHRVMKWMKGAHKGKVVAGGVGMGEDLTKLNSPFGMTVDQLGDIYAIDLRYNRVVCWRKEATQGSIVVDGNGYGRVPDQFDDPRALSFNRQGNLYVVDTMNCRIQRFDIDSG